MALKIEDGDNHNVEHIVITSQILESDLKKLGLKVRHHEDNLRFLKTQMDKLEESIFDAHMKLGNQYVPQDIPSNDEGSERQTIEHILQQEKSAAGIIWQLKIRHSLQASKLPVTMDVLGVVATLGKVKDDNISRLFSEYLGLETMLAIVCKSYEGVKALEKYNKDVIDKSSGLYGLGPSIGRHLHGRFLAFCLENIRPYPGEFLAEDPQKRLALLKPRLPNGQCPPGFLGFAVNMIDLDHNHLSFLTYSGHGLRETLFYSLFSHLQVYKTRAEMELAMPCISAGAISLDGGMIRQSGLFFLGDRKDVEVRFPVRSEKLSSVEIVELQQQLNLMNWRKERFSEDMQREEALLADARKLFRTKREELEKYLTEAQHYATQFQFMPGTSGNAIAKR